MRGNVMQQWPGESRKTESAEQAVRRHKENCELRLARIANGAHPDYKNGTQYPDLPPKK